MNVDNSVNPNLPEELKKQLEAARNTVAVAEQEALRFVLLRRQNETILRDLLGQIEQNNAVIEQQNAKLAGVKQEQQNLMALIAGENELLKKVRAEAAQLQVQKALDLEEMRGKHEALAKAEGELRIKEAALDEKAKSLAEQSAKVLSDKKRMADFLGSL